MNAGLIRTTALLAVFPLVLCSGCFRPGREFNALRKDVVKSLDATVQEEEAFGLGRVSLGLARGVLRLVPEDAGEDADFAAQLIGAVRSVEVGTYSFDGAVGAHGMEALAKIDDGLQDAGLEPMVRHVEPGEVVAIYVELKGSKLRQMFIVTVDSSELTLVRLRGKLEEAMTLALNHQDF